MSKRKLAVAVATPVAAVTKRVRRPVQPDSPLSDSSEPSVFEEHLSPLGLSTDTDESDGSQSDSSIDSSTNSRLYTPPATATTTSTTSEITTPTASTEPTTRSALTTLAHSITQPATSTTTATTATTATADTFDPRVCRPSALPIFAARDAVIRPSAADMSDEELANCTFPQYLDYFLSHKSFATERKYLFSDEQYCHLLGWITSGMKRVIDYVRSKQLGEEWSSWLSHRTSENTYRYMLMEYHGTTVNDIQKGPVLVCFIEPPTQAKKKAKRRHPSSKTPTTLGLMRRCVPASQIQRVIDHCHAGDLSRSIHHGQTSTFDNVSNAFDGISRGLVREYVRRCKTCSEQQVRQTKVALVPITANRLFERVEIDLIDYSHKSSHGFTYILHAVDHYSKFHWAWALKDKSTSSVAFHLASLLGSIGPVNIQSDQGSEFRGSEVLEVLRQFNRKPINSAPYTPQTNGLVERGNGMLKRAIHHWLVQEGTNDWYPPLGRIGHQINCNKPRTAKCTPFELMYSKKPRKIYSSCGSDDTKKASSLLSQ